MKGSDDHVLHNIVLVWKEHKAIEVETISLGRSFLKHQLKYKDTYLKYIQFIIVHNRFYTNEKLFKMGMKSSNVCVFLQKMN